MRILNRNPIRRFSRYFRINQQKAEHLHHINGVTLFDKYKSLKDDYDLQSKFVEEEAVHLRKLKSQMNDQYLENLTSKTLGRTDSRTEEMPEKIGDYFYYSSHRYIEDKDYLVISRFKKDRRLDSEVVFDPVKEKAVNKRQIQSFVMNKLVLSDCQMFLGTIIDLDNNERPKGFIKNLQNNSIFPVRLQDCVNFVFSKDNKFVYYVKQDKDNRPCSVYKHRITETGTISDLLVFEDTDKKYFVDVQLVKSKDYYVFLCTGKSSFKLHILKRQPTETMLETEHSRPVQITSPEDKILAFQKTSKGCFFVQYKNNTTRILFVSSEDFEHGLNKLRNSPADPNSDDISIFEKNFNFKVIYSLPEDSTLTESDIFESCVLLYTTTGGNNQIIKLSYPNFEATELKFADSVSQQYGNVYPSSNMELDPRTCTFYHDSPFVCNEAYEIDFETNKLNKKESSSIGGKPFDTESYKASLLDFPARDGTKIPMWCLHHNSINPLRPKYPLRCFMRFYGCYGMPTDLGFSVTDWNMLEENWMLLFPLIRGSGDFGPKWHQQAILTNKHKSITDIEDAAMFAIANGMTHSSLLCAKSSSSGGGLLAAAINRNPHLFKAAILEAPFLDILNMLSDKDMPLSQADYEEFGDPSNKEYFKSILSICPYNNIRSQEYPSILVNCYDDDYRTPVWQVLKWARKVRDIASDPSRVVSISGKNIFVNVIEGSHVSAGSKKQVIEDRCFELAFLNHIVRRKTLDFEVEKKLKLFN